MTTDPDPVWSCARKKRHPEEKGARAAIARMHAEGLDPDRFLEVYGCGGCGGWHVGHPPGLQARRRAAADGGADR